MKNLLPLLCCFLPGLAHAQAPPSELRTDSATHQLTRAETIQVPGASQADLYARAQGWLATAYQTSAQATPKTTGVVQGTGWREIEMVMGEGKSLPLKLWYTVTITVQPARYYYAITGFQTQDEPTPTTSAPEKQALEAVVSTGQRAATTYTNYGQQAADAAQAIAATIKASMAAPTSPSDKSR